MQKRADYKLITCLLPHHKSLGILQSLVLEKGLISANKNNARGSSYTSDFLWVEMEFLEVLVEADRADEIYNYLLEIADIDSPGGGLIFQHALSRSTHYALPED